MKGIILLVGCSIGLFINSHAQDSLKVTAKRFTTELNVNLFQGELSFNNALNQVKVRYFTSNQLALRIGISFDSKKDKSDQTRPYGPNSYDYEETKTSTLIGLNFGVEKHFKGTKRLSPYIGAELSIATKGAKHTIEANGEEETIKGAWRDHQFIPDNNGYYWQYTYVERGFTSYGVNAVAGFDFYIAKHFYFGYEFNLGVNKIVYKDIDTTSTYDLDPNDIEDHDDSGFTAGFNLLNGIRLGFVF